MITQIKTSQELEFVVFCIENVAIKLEMGAEILYNIFKKNEIILNYIINNYEVLHTQSKDYIVDDLLNLMREEKIEL